MQINIEQDSNKVERGRYDNKWITQTLVDDWIDEYKKEDVSDYDDRALYANVTVVEQPTVYTKKEGGGVYLSNRKYADF